MNKEKNIIEKKNINFFSFNTDYQKNVATIDTYKILYSEITNVIKSSNNLLDIGHGGSFDYDTSKIKFITGLDLDKMIDGSTLPKNIKLKEGSALNIPDDIKNFDTTLVVMLLHHLVGKTVSENLENLDKCFNQIRKTLASDGRLVVVESCVPKWFYLIEKILFKPSSILIKKFMKHPPAFQFTQEILINYLNKNNYKNINIKKIKQGKFILQYGLKIPTILTPVETVIITANK
jgi:SAM-dependent methyltransferase